MLKKTDKLVWLVGGGTMQFPMAREIVRRGYKLMMTDLNPDCVCRARGLPDFFAPISVYDLYGQLDYAKQYGFNPDAILTVATDASVEVAGIADYFGLPGIDPDTANRVRNKAEMREALRTDYPRWASCTPLFDCGWPIFPAVVKANNSSGSRGMSIVSSREELPEAIALAISANRIGSIAVIEEFLTGKDIMPDLEEFSTSEVAIEGFVQAGEWYYANGALRLFWRDKPGIEAGHFNPFVPDDKLTLILKDATQKLGVLWGPMKFDLMYTDRGWVILECATRLSGGFDHMYTCPKATGKDVTGAMLDLAMGEVLDHSKLEPTKDEVACCFAPIYEPGRIRGWNQDQWLDIFLTEHHEIKPLVDNSKRPAFIIRTGRDHEEALQKVRKIAKGLEPVYV